MSLLHICFPSNMIKSSRTVPASQKPGPLLFFQTRSVGVTFPPSNSVRIPKLTSKNIDCSFMLLWLLVYVCSLCYILLLDCNFWGERVLSFVFGFIFPLNSTWRGVGLGNCQLNRPVDEGFGGEIPSLEVSFFDLEISH